MLHVHRAERADALVGALAALLAEPPDDPLTPEWVAVPTRGIERWIAQELALRLGATPGRGDGVCANVEFPFPGRVVGGAIARVAGIDPDADPWRPERLVWTLLDIADAQVGQGWLGALGGHLAGAETGGRRYAAVRHVADLYDRYAVHRPAMLDRWRDGADVDATGAPLARDARWQAELWRRAGDRVGVDDPAARLGAGIEALRGDPSAAEVPPRLSLFGMTALPGSYVDVLEALATHRDVHLFLLHPSPALWARVAEAAPALRRPLHRDGDPTRRAPRHPLLASWGRDAREMQLVVARAGAAEHHHSAPAAAPATLLQRLQAGVREDTAPPGPPVRAGDVDPRAELQTDDRSVQVHACHGRTRQVEVLRDAILHLLAGDPTLEPRDIIVMCPDIEAFAPVVHAVFGAHRADDEPDAITPASAGLPDLRVRLADRAIRSTNPVLRTVAELLHLAGGRLTAMDVLDFAAREPVRRRFGLDDDALERIGAWVAEARVRWGLDAEHRGDFGLGGVDANTWRAGLDRILLGVAMADQEDRLVGGAVPLDDVEGSDVPLAGRLAELVDRLGTAIATFREPHPIAGWQQVVAAAADALTATRERDRWQRLQLHRILHDVVDEATLDSRPSDVPLTLPEVRILLEDRLRGRPTRANHRTGDLTVCTLVPMRSVPHRVVCLLGMDDATFPRKTTADGDDLIDRDPHVGDRDARTEDRQLLLDALLAAGDAFVVTYTGRDERTNEHRPPAVPVGELLDTIDRTVRAADGTPARRRVLVEHPLQASDERSFRSEGGPFPGAPWSFDPVALAGARARAAQTAAPPFLAEPLGPREADTVALDDLVAFVEHPVRAFLRQRLGVQLERRVEEPSESVPVDLHPLDEHVIGDRLLQARLTGAATQGWVAAERARGLLPPGALADASITKIADGVEAVLSVAAAEADLESEVQALEVDVALDGRALVGTVAGVAGGMVQFVRYGKVRAHHRLAAWVRLLAAAAASPDVVRGAVTIGRSDKGDGARVVRICLPEGVDGEDLRVWAVGHLGCLVDLYDRGLCEPLPISCRASAAYAETVRRNADLSPSRQRDPAADAAREWTTGYTFPLEDRDAEHLLVYGEQLAFERLLELLPRDDEAGEGWALEEATRFGRCARRLWDGLLDHERVEDVP